MIFLPYSLLHLFADTRGMISLKRASQTEAGSDSSVLIAQFPCGNPPGGIQNSSSSRPSSRAWSAACIRLWTPNLAKMCLV